MSTNIFCAIAIVIFTVNNVCCEYSSEDCWKLGMNKANLLCSSCKLMKKYDLDDLREACLSCCTPGETISTIKRYPKAQLEVCTCKFGAYPQIQAFIQSDRPAKFPNLSIRYVRGLDPIIKLMDFHGTVQEVLAVEKWDTDAVEEFLSSHLDSPHQEKDYLKNNKV